ncbi:MAG: hypothetical protein K8R25_09620 [Methanosarcinales archaeon]|nr:hypothetical protein [Methanosarcinales archaeon]
MDLDLTEKRNSEYEDIFYEITIYKDGLYIPRTAKKNTIRISGTEGNDLSYQYSLNKFDKGRYEIKAILYTKENGVRRNVFDFLHYTS